MHFFPDDSSATIIKEQVSQKGAQDSISHCTFFPQTFDKVPQQNFSSTASRYRTQIHFTCFDVFQEKKEKRYTLLYCIGLHVMSKPFSLSLAKHNQKILLYSSSVGISDTHLHQKIQQHIVEIQFCAKWTEYPN